MISLQLNVCFAFGFDDHGAIIGPPWYDLFPTFSLLCFGIVSLQISNNESTNSVFFFIYAAIIVYTNVYRIKHLSKKRLVCLV